MRCGLRAPAERACDATRTVYLFGTLCRVTVWASEAATARRAAEAGVRALERTAGCLNPFDPDSELMRLNRVAAQREVAVSETLFDVLVVARAASAATAGRFDLTAWPILDLWRRCAAADHWPSRAERTAATAAVDYRRVRLAPARRGVAFNDDRVRVDLSSIAKGAALDAALRAIRADGADGALLDAGGALLVWDRWGRTLDVAVAHPARRHDLVAGLSLCNQAVATSGQGESRLSVAGRPIGHLFDVTSGLPVASPRTSVSVITASALTADLCATVAFMLGPCRAAAFFGRPSPVAWLWVDGDQIDEVITGDTACCKRS